MTIKKRIQFSNIVRDQVPSYVKEEFPLIVEFLSQYYIGQEFQGSPVDLIQNIDQYIKIDNTTHLSETTTTLSQIGLFDEEILVDNTSGFPDSYGLIKIDNEIITYTGKTDISFTGCIRGFSGISSYKSSDQMGDLEFSQTEVEEHDSGSVVYNLSILFLKEFLEKIKYQLAPGFESRDFYSAIDDSFITRKVNQALFLKQSRDFYSSKGTDESFKILFKALYGERVDVIKPKEFLVKPSDANYQITFDFVVESLDGDISELRNSTLYQDTYGEDIPKAYAPITKVEKIKVYDAVRRKTVKPVGITTDTYYKISIDAGFDRDINVEGSIYGKFSYHPKTKLIGEVGVGATTLDVDSTIGFPREGELSVVYKDTSIGIVSYSSKSINQFYGCSNVTGTIVDGSNLDINTYAYGRSVVDGRELRLRLRPVLTNLKINEETYGYESGDKIKIKTLGIENREQTKNEWLLNIANNYSVAGIGLTATNTYKVFINEDHNLHIGDNITIISSLGNEKDFVVKDVLSSKSFICEGSTFTSLNASFSVKRKLLKGNSDQYPVANIITNVQNTYIDGEKVLVASSSVPFYNQQKIEPKKSSYVFSGTYIGDTFKITDGIDHNFQTGDAIYYIPEQSSFITFNESGERVIAFNVISSLFDEGVYFVKRVDANNVKFALSPSQIHNGEFITLQSERVVTNNKIELFNLHNKNLSSQKLLREFAQPEFKSDLQKTAPGLTGMLVNGVEVLNYKSNDGVYYGPITEISVMSTGSGYDVINPPVLSITDNVGSGATGNVSVVGNFEEIRVLDPGFDYTETPTIEITGGNGSGATAKVNTKLISHEVIFNSLGSAALVSLATTSSIGFTTYHKLRNGERITYETFGQKAVGGLSTSASYYVNVRDVYTIKLHKNYGDAISGVNTVSLTSYGVGNHSIKSFSQKLVVASVSIINPGSGYENKLRTCPPVGINTALSTVSIKNHGYKTGEIITYNVDGTGISGLSTNTEYYVSAIDNDSFKLSQVGITTNEKDFYLKTNQFVDLSFAGIGTHLFNYPEIKVRVLGSVGIASTENNEFKCVLQPIVRGQVSSVHLRSNGSSYGVEDIINYLRTPNTRLISGENAQATPIVSNGKIVDVIINKRGSGYNSPPNLVITGDGVGAVLTPVLNNGELVEVKIIESGIGYTQDQTGISIISSGSGCVLDTNITRWTINLFSKYLNSVSDDDGFLTEPINNEYGLQYAHLYAPRNLRKILYAKNQEGKTIYGRKDLIIRNSAETTSTDHSPIIGWAYDGNPIYGPYAYISRSGGTIIQMKSGYSIKLNSSRPSTSAYPEGFFVEDFSYVKSDDETVLDENNGRFCVTPDFPKGVYAYFATVNPIESSSGPFKGYKQPVFPYLIGHSYKAVPNEFNFQKTSNQDDIDLNQTKWFRSVSNYNLNLQDFNGYDYIISPNRYKEQVSNIKFAKKGSVDSVGILTGGTKYRVDDSLVIESDGTGGSGFYALISKVSGKIVNNISVATSSISDVEFYADGNNKNFISFSNDPHGFKDRDLIVISGLNTTSSLLEGSYNIGVSTNTFSLKVGVGSTGITGIITYFSLGGNLSFPRIRENDILGIGTERVKVLSVDLKSSRIKVLRSVDGTVGSSHTTTTVLYEKTRKLVVENVGYKTAYDYRVNKEIYFDPKESVSIGTSAGVGIGSTLVFSNPGTGVSSVFVPTKTIYLPNHNLKTGDNIQYYLNGGGFGLGISTNGISSSRLQDQSILYVAKISDDLIGIATVMVGLGSTGVFSGIANTTRNIGTLFFNGIGNGNNHSFKTLYNDVPKGKISKNIVTVSLAETHGLLNNDVVEVSVNPSISTSITIKYNDYNRVLVANPKSFTAVGVNTTNDTITIPNHGYYTGEKVIHTSSSPSGGLINDKIYYVYVVDSSTIKLTTSTYESLQSRPSFIGITSASTGDISQVNPKLDVYKNTTINFDLSDSSLSYIQNSNNYPSFEFKIYTDKMFNQEYDTSKSLNSFDVGKSGIIGVTPGAKVTLRVDEYTPDVLYYRLIPLDTISNPITKKEIVIDNSVEWNSQIIPRNSKYNGKHSILVSGSQSFTYNLKEYPERNAYVSAESELKYDTDSKTAFGSIKNVKILNGGFNFKKMPGFTTVTSEYGTGAVLDLSSSTIGKVGKIEIMDIGFDYPSDFTLRPTTKLAEIVQLEPLASFESIGISSVGRGYSLAPKLLVFDGRTKNLVPEVDLKYDLNTNEVQILKNTFGITNVQPTIIPIQNTNGVGIASMRFNDSTNDVTVFLSVGFSTQNTFPFATNDKVLIENVSVGVGSTGKGYNSANYNYGLFTIKSVAENRGGLGIVTYSMGGYLNPGEVPGRFDFVNSSGIIVPAKYFPQFNIVLKKNNFLDGEKVIDITNNESSGKVSDWNAYTETLRIETINDFTSGNVVEGQTSKTRGIVKSVTNFDSNYEIAEKSKVLKGWDRNTGFLNDNIQRLQDNDYYQNFSYSLKSKVDFSTWEDPVSVLNHTTGFKKFSDYQLESKLSPQNETSMIVGVTTNITGVDVIIDMLGIGDLNCVADFDLVRENSLFVGSDAYSNELYFNSRTITDYAESIGNRVLIIDDISDQFNSFPRPTRYAETYRWLLSDTKAIKFLTYIKDRRYTSERQFMFVTFLIDDDRFSFINQYARLETVLDLGSFDTIVDGSEGVLQFFPNRFTVNDYEIRTLSFNVRDNLVATASSEFGVTESGTSVKYEVLPPVVVPTSLLTNIISMGATYSSAKMLVEIKGPNGEYEFDELNLTHNGTDVELLEYGQLSNHSRDVFSSVGLGTYIAYISGSDVKVDFRPRPGIGATIAVSRVSFANTSVTGLGTTTINYNGTYDMKFLRLESKQVSIAASSSPIETVIATYPNVFDGGYCLMSVNDLTNNETYMSEIMVGDDDNEVYYTEWGAVYTSGSLGNVGAAITGGTINLTFTPNTNTEVQVKTFLNAMRFVDDTQTITSIAEGTLETEAATYSGTERDIKREFPLSHKSFNIFKRTFDGSDPAIANTTTDTITIGNHFFVTGEELQYTYAGAGTSQAIGVALTTFVGIGTTDKLPGTVYAVKINESKFQLAATAEDALKTTPKLINLTHVGIGTSHTFTCKNQNSKVIVAIDNIIQSPIVSTAITTQLRRDASSADDILYFTGITSFFGGDLIKMGNEIMRIEGVGIGSTNAIRVRRPWLGTVESNYNSGDLITKVTGSYNIVENTLNFVEAPYGNIPLSTTTNAPDDRYWVGISTNSKFQGRVFLRSGTPNTTSETYSKNYIYDDISSAFNGTRKAFTLKSSRNDVSGIANENIVMLVNDIFQGPGLTNDYVMSETSGITSVTFTGTASSVAYDPNNANIPVGGLIVSVGSSQGFGYQPLVSAGATVVVSVAGTISNIAIGNTGSGYRANTKYELITNVTNNVGIGSTIITIDNKNSVFKSLELANTGSNCTVSISTYVAGATIVSSGSTYIIIGSASTSSKEIPANSTVYISIANPPVGYVNVGVANSNVGISTITHVGIATIYDGHVTSNVHITNPGSGYTSTGNLYVVIEDPLPYSDIPLVYSSQYPSGIGTQATISFVVGSGTSITDFEIQNLGYGYGQGEYLTVQSGGITGIPTTSNPNFVDFTLSIQKTFNDKFTAWSIGELQVLDKLDDLFDATRTVFPLTLLGDLISIRAAKGSNIDVEATLLIFINDVLQVPGQGYVFKGGSNITFTEAPKPGDTSKIIFYRGSGSIDVTDVEVLDTVKVGDNLTIKADSSFGQPASYNEDERIVTQINTTDTLETNTYYGSGVVQDATLLRTITWCRQTEDLFINNKEVGKDRELYEANIFPSSYLIKNVGIGSTIAYVDNIRPFFNQTNENNLTLTFQKYVTFVSQDIKVGAAATAIVSTAGTISSFVISEGGSGYEVAPEVSLSNPGIGTTGRAIATSSITAGVVTSISLTNPGVGYTSSNPPKVLIEQSAITLEDNTTVSYEGDFGIVSGIAQTSVGIASTALVFDLIITPQSFLRNTKIVSSASTVSGIQTGDYFVIYNSNVGNGLTSINSDGSIIGIGTNFIDNVYKAESVSIAQTDAVGFGLTYVAKVTVSVSSYNGLTGFGYSSFYGEFSWGKINLGPRSGIITHYAYTLNGVTGISTGTIVKRSRPLKYVNYLS